MQWVASILLADALADWIPCAQSIFCLTAEGECTANSDTFIAEHESRMFQNYACVRSVLCLFLSVW